MNQSRFDFIIKNHPKRIDFFMLASEDRSDAVVKIRDFIYEKYKKERSQNKQWFEKNFIDLIVSFLDRYYEESSIDFDAAYSLNCSVSPIVQDMFRTDSDLGFQEYLRIVNAFILKDSFKDGKSEIDFVDQEASNNHTAFDEDVQIATNIYKEISKYKKIQVSPKPIDLINEALELLNEAKALLIRNI